MSRGSGPHEEAVMTGARDSDFYALELLVDDSGRDLLHRVRQFMEKEVEPVINDYWGREEFPHGLIPQLAGLGIAGLSYSGYGCGGQSRLLSGMVSMQIARVDSSISTFM